MAAKWNTVLFCDKRSWFEVVAAAIVYPRSQGEQRGPTTNGDQLVCQRISIH